MPGPSASRPCGGRAVVALGLFAGVLTTCAASSVPEPSLDSRNGSLVLRAPGETADVMVQRGKEQPVSLLGRDAELAEAIAGLVGQATTHEASVVALGAALGAVDKQATRNKAAIDSLSSSSSTIAENLASEALLARTNEQEAFSLAAAAVSAAETAQVAADEAGSKVSRATSGRRLVLALDAQAVHPALLPSALPQRFQSPVRLQHQ